MASDMGEDATKRHDRRVSLSVMAEALLHPKLDIPYFSHEPLDPLLYPGDLSKPVEGAPENLQLEEILQQQRQEDPAELSSGSDDTETLEQNINISLGRLVPEQTCWKHKAAIEEEEEEEEDDVSEKIPAKKIKLEGGLPVVAKKISAFDDMDSDDQLLYNLKLAKCKKTIGTRFTRMKRFFSKDLDRRLETARLTGTPTT
ncbi:hypothetical protein VTN96DRAFT_2824 [Rasamsonia emersonii]